MPVDVIAAFHLLVTVDEIAALQHLIAALLHLLDDAHRLERAPRGTGYAASVVANVIGGISFGNPRALGVMGPTTPMGCVQHHPVSSIAPCEVREGRSRGRPVQ